MRTAAWVLLVLLTGAGVLWGRPTRPHFWWERLPAFYALLGFAGAWLLVAGPGKRWLQRPESYYDQRSG